MAAAFNEQEREAIVRRLRDAARRCAATIGMRKTTLEQLAREAGISKSAFYRFYDSKERLFLDILEEWHTAIYGSAAAVLEVRAALPLRTRVAQAILEAARVMSEGDTMALFAQDLPAMLRRLPPEVVQAHYDSDDQHIERLIDRAGVRLRVSRETACAIIRILFMSLFQRAEVGAHYQQALEALVYSACEQIIAE